MRQGLLNYFQILKKRELLGPAYLFIGEDRSVVKDIAKLISCSKDPYFCDQCWDCKRINSGNHPDLFTVRSDSPTIGIDAIREGIRFFSLKSFRIKNKIMIIEEAQNLTPVAANAFLKTLEEPPQHSFIAIIASKLEGLPPTVISRCRKIFLPQESKVEDRSLRKSVFEFLRGSDIRFPDRKRFSAFLWTLIMVLREQLLSGVNLENDPLPEACGNEIILSSYSQDQVHSILKDTLKIYGAYKSVNMNLALNLIRLKL